MILKLTKTNLKGSHTKEQARERDMTQTKQEKKHNKYTLLSLFIIKLLMVTLTVFILTQITGVTVTYTPPSWFQSLYYY